MSSQPRYFEPSPFRKHRKLILHHLKQYGQRQQRPSYKEKFTECRDRLNTANNIREDLDRQLAIAEAKLRALEDECGLLLDVLVHQSAIQHGHPLPEYGPEHQQFLQSHQGHHAYAYAPPYRADPGPPEVYNPAEDATMSYRGGPPVPPPPPMERLSSNGSGHREYSHRPMSGMVCNCHLRVASRVPDHAASLTMNAAVLELLNIPQNSTTSLVTPADLNRAINPLPKQQRCPHLTPITHIRQGIIEHILMNGMQTASVNAR
ncbi:hypothetical protein SISNIDRAFT_465039 [Sistotremastrum niveocremeum HHB9708]|uniref:Uncharacterized protein n=1 Tax=Sistotremastrum niveocremeum HHB9708 TaxID=1314777 RepID=A0A164W5V3_9AGAM|nr:hypothetical protein SISNIDRAFT_465039 [Sistotremastrum niveocremeum HHB9708]